MFWVTWDIDHLFGLSKKLFLTYNHLHSRRLFCVWKKLFLASIEKCKANANAWTVSWTTSSLEKRLANLLCSTPTINQATVNDKLLQKSDGAAHNRARTNKAISSITTVSIHCSKVHVYGVEQGGKGSEAGLGAHHTVFKTCSKSNFYKFN